MIKASFDRPRLQRSLKRFARDFGDSNAQAIARWGVQSCREMAGSTQVFGKTAAAKKKQWNSIEAGVNTIVNVIDKPGRRTANILTSVSEVSDWIDSNRDKRGRTRAVPIQQRPFVTAALLKKTITDRRKLAGIAKGGWIGAGQDIAMAQKGSDRIAIGKNFLGYAQRHSRFGSSTRPRSGWQPSAMLSNRARHSGVSYVLKKAHMRSAIDWGLKKTIQWYRSALRRQNQKQKP
jgi:hypothetical protein